MTEPIVEVRGEATERGGPDLATLSVTVTGNGRRPENVTDLLARRQNAVADIVRGREDAVEEFSNTGIHVGPVWERGGVLRARGFEGNVSSSVVVRDFEALVPLVLALSEVEECRVHGPAWSLRADNPMYRQARLAAVDDARRRADDYAAAFGSHVTGLLGISDLEPAPFLGRPMLAMARGMVADQPELELEPTEQEVTGRVTVRFAISTPEL